MRRWIVARKLASAGVMSAYVLVSGCGGAATSGASASGFSDRAGAICRRAYRQLAASRPTTPPYTAAERRGYWTTIINIARPTLAALAALHPPRRLRADYRRELMLIRRRIALEVRERRIVSRPGPVPAAESFPYGPAAAIDRIAESEQRLWTQMGIPRCVAR